MQGIGDSVVKRDHLDKISGQAIYVSDYPQEDFLTGRLLHSQKAHAKLTVVHVPELPAGYFFVDKHDVPGDNRVNIVQDDLPVYAEDTVEYIGEAIGMLCGPDPEVVGKLLAEIEVVYEELPVITDIHQAEKTFFDYTIAKGDTKKAFAEADELYEETFSTGYQEQAYLEVQGMAAEYQADGKVFLHGSMQCPYYVLNAAKRALGLPKEKLRIAQDVTGGAFGGKEDWPSILGAQVGVAAMAAKHNVRCIYERREDIEFTSKKHPSCNTYRAAIKNGRVTALEIEVLFNAGAYTTLTPVVLQRGIICANGVYDIEHLYIHGRAVKTNTVPSGAFRGFGGPQTFFSIEMLMEHLAKKLGVPVLDFKLRHLAQQGSETSTSGKYHFPVPLKDMAEELESAAQYRKKRAIYDQPQQGRYRRGIGLSLCFHGAGFTGSGERDFIKAVAKLHKYPDGRVELLVANTDMGQGLRTSLPKIVAKELCLPLEKILYAYPDTDFVPDSGPTVASRSMMIVGQLMYRAARELKEKWQEGADQIVEVHYQHPDFLLPFSLEKFRGDAYPTYSWLVNVIELEIDTYTGRAKVLGAYGNFDVGTVIDRNIVIGQMEGGFLQAIGHSGMEYLTADASGRIRNNSFADYILPTAVDVPKLKVLLHEEKYPEGPYGAKGAGELPAVGAPAAYLSAIEQALGGKFLEHVPFTAEDTLKAWLEVKGNA